MDANELLSGIMATNFTVLVGLTALLIENGTVRREDVLEDLNREIDEASITGAAAAGSVILINYRTALLSRLDRQSPSEVLRKGN